MARERAERIDLFKHMNDKTVEAGALFLRTAILVNGGACIAVLGFVASIVKEDTDYIGLVSGVADALMYFAWGVLAGLAAIGLTYVTNYATTIALENEDTKWARSATWFKRTIHLITLCASLLSMGLFALGAMAVKEAIVGGFS